MHYTPSEGFFTIPENGKNVCHDHYWCNMLYVSAHIYYVPKCWMHHTEEHVIYEVTEAVLHTVSVFRFLCKISEHLIHCELHSGNSHISSCDICECDTFCSFY